jgi:hypothetical protein
MDSDNGNGLDQKSIVDLKIRLNVLDAVIKEAKAKGDERWHEPERQRKVIVAALEKKIKQQQAANREEEKGDQYETPEPVVIGMKPARMVAKNASPWD